jgi:hypothetical protein
MNTSQRNKWYCSHFRDFILQSPIHNKPQIAYRFFGDVSGRVARGRRVENYDQPEVGPIFAIRQTLFRAAINRFRFCLLRGAPPPFRESR